MLSLQINGVTTCLNYPLAMVSLRNPAYARVWRPCNGLAAPRRQMWQQLAQEPLHERFFHLLERLRDTDEFRFQPVDLARRVWEVIESARVKLRLELSRQEVHELSADIVVAVPGRPASPQPGPSTRQ